MKLTLKIIFVLICALSFACSKEDKEEAAEVAPKIVSDKTASLITGTTAKFGGNVYWEEGFTMTKRGVCYSTSPDPTIANTCVYAANGTGIFYCNLSNLKIITPYYIRAFATYLNGKTYYGKVISFTTTRDLTMAKPTYDFISRTRVTFTDSIPGDGGYAVTARGVCYSTSPNPTYPESDHTTDGTGTGKYTSTFPVLDGQKKYYAKPYFVNSVGTFYGEEMSFTTFPLPITTMENEVSDIDGNIYHTIKIGTQVWMVENLKTTHYRNGGLIPTNSGSVGNEAEPKYQWIHKNNTENLDTYGRLYTWYAATDRRGIAPDGWRVPSIQDWATLVNSLSGYLTEDQYNNGYYALALCSKSNWLESSKKGTPGYTPLFNNSTGLSLVPGGKFEKTYGFIMMGGYGCYTSINLGDTESTCNSILFQWDIIYARAYIVSKDEGISIRCIKND